MVGSEDWLFRPVMHHMVLGTALFDGSISLGQIALLNEAISVEAENQHRRSRHEAAKRPKTGR